MAFVDIRINGRNYKVRCNDNQEEHLLFLASKLNEKVMHLAKSIDNSTSDLLLILLTALQLEDISLEKSKEIKFLKSNQDKLNNNNELINIKDLESMLYKMEEGFVSRIDNIADKASKIIVPEDVES